MFSSRAVYLFLILYLALLLGLAPINILSFDTYYYWDWSRHLALSYYDGSPMIAYFIRLSTFLFGDSLFALSLIGIIVITLTSIIIYKTARFFLTPIASCMAMLSWLFAPLVTLDILKQTTYDSPLALFWTLTLYYTIKFIKTNKIKELYFIGASAGLMMLSKYTGIVLILSLLIFLICTSYRSIFKTKHFYFAILLGILIFSPVLIWNYQTHWQSFTYQLTTHQLNTGNPLYNAITTFFNSFITSLNVMLIPPFMTYCIKIDEKQAVFVKLCRIICIGFLVFFLYAATQAGIRELWLVPYLVSSSLLFGYCYEQFQYRKLCRIPKLQILTLGKTAISLVILYGVISLAILIDNTSKYNLINSKKFVFYHLFQKFNTAYPELPNTILTSGWFQARMLFFLKNKPNIYTLNCNTPQNQYALWSTDINRQIADKTLKEALFIDKQDRQDCLKKYFDTCQKIPTDSYHFRHKNYALNVYKCQNL